MAAEEDFDVLSEKWKSLVQNRFNNKIAKAFEITLENLFDEADAFIEDLDQGAWDDSAFMDELHAEATGFEDTNFCATFFKVLKAIVNGDIAEENDDNIFSPDDVDWTVSDDEKKIDQASKFMDMQCPNAGFQDAGKNKNLLKAIAVSRYNQVPLISMLIDMFELSHIDQIINKKNKFKTEIEWIKKCEFFKEYKVKKKVIDIIRRAMTEFKHRLSGGGLQEVIVNKIQDDVNVYIAYILEINNIIKNIIQTNKQCCPLQIDVVILGREHVEINDEDKKDYDYDDDDDDAMMAQIASEMGNSFGIGALANPLPPEGMAVFLASKKIDMVTGKISINDLALASRIIQQSISKKLGNKRNQRIIICIDRTSKRECHENEEEDMFYMYQLDGFNEIRKDYNEEHMSWMTKREIFPDWKSKGGLRLYKGGGDDIGDNGFVFSFHIHSGNKVKCEQFIKSQRLPFLPYHMISLWPLYFDEKFNKVNETNDSKYIYNRWKLPTDDAMFIKWIKVIDPELYKAVEKQHLKQKQ